MTDADKAKAKAIVDTWYWQPDSWRRTSFVRFYESAPMASDVFKLVLDYLKSETATSIVMAGKLIELGETWKATDAWYQTMPGEKWQGTESTKIRVYQAFRAESDTSGGPYTVENGCQYAVTHEFFWDVAEIPTVPASSSGVSYTLQGVVRDRETGLYSCVLEHRTRVQQDVPEYFTSKTIFEEQKEEAHHGVKEGVSAGKAASVGNGTAVTRKVTKNSDCTTDVQNVTTVDKPVSDAVVTKEETTFETRTTTEKRNQASAASMSLTPGKSVRDEKTPTGLHNQTTTETVEKPVSDAVVEYTRTLHGTQKSVTHRNQATPVNGSGMKIGERRSTRKTDGGKNDNTIVTPTIAAAGVVERSENKTIFETATSERENVAADGTLPRRSATEAGGGKTHRVDVRLNDDGTADVTTDDATEKPVTSSRVMKRKTLRGVTTSTTDRNTSNDDATVTNVGDTVEVEKTPGGLYNRTVTKIEKTPVGEVGGACERSVGQHTHTTTTNVAEKPSVEVSNASQNQVVRKRTQETEEGTWDIEETTTDFLPARSTASGGSAGVTETVESGINEPAVPSEVGGVNVEVSFSVTPNEHGSASYTKRTRRHLPSTTTATSRLPTETRVTRTTTNNTSLTESAAHGSASATPNGMGGANTQVTEVTPHPIDSGWITWDSETKLKNGTYKYHHGLRVFRNLALPPTPDKGSNVSLNCAINAYGLYDGSMTYSDLYAWQEDSSGGGTYGGQQAGTYAFFQFKQDATGRRKKRKVTIPVIVFYGQGNEGTEAAAAANITVYPGVHLPYRTYATGEPTPGAWGDDN